MISGTNGLLGAADGGFILRKEKRTSNAATLEVSGRDQPDQKIYLNRNPETLVWELEKTETELWKQPPDPLLENIADKITRENSEWQTQFLNKQAVLIRRWATICCPIYYRRKKKSKRISAFGECDTNDI